MDLSTIKLIVDVGSFGIVAWIVLVQLPKSWASLERLADKFIADSKAQREESRKDAKELRDEYRAEIREERTRFIAAIEAHTKAHAAAMSRLSGLVEETRDKLD